MLSRLLQHSSFPSGVPQFALTCVRTQGPSWGPGLLSSAMRLGPMAGGAAV